MRNQPASRYTSTRQRDVSLSSCLLFAGAAFALLASCGSVGAKQWKESYQYDFKGSPDGEHPLFYGNLLFDFNQQLFYGTTAYGGSGCQSTDGCGTVFSLANNGKTENVLYSFQGPVYGDGATPQGTLVECAGKNTNGCFLVGTVQNGAANNMGAVFTLTNKKGVWKENLLYSFGTNDGSNDGSNPNSGVIQWEDDGFNWSTSVYGTTGGGGVHQAGAIIAVSLTTGNETLLHSMNGTTDGATVPAGLVADDKGNLYGVAEFAGDMEECNNAGCGTIFRVSQKGDFKVLHYFAGGPTDGRAPTATLVVGAGSDLVLYGTTVAGGTNDGGTIFRLDATTDKYKVLYKDFANGSYPLAALVFDDRGYLYGTSQNGGQLQGGYAFELTPTGTFTDIHDFGSTNPCCDAYSPTSGLFFTQYLSKRRLFGAAPGGTQSCVTEAGCGVVFLLTEE